MTLTAAEREKFAAWLEHEANADRIILDELRKMNVPPQMIGSREREIISAVLIARKLRSISDETIG